MPQHLGGLGVFTILDQVVAIEIIGVHSVGRDLYRLFEIVPRLAVVAEPDGRFSAAISPTPTHQPGSASRRDRGTSRRSLSVAHSDSP